jgi:hypothetical protein
MNIDGPEPEAAARKVVQEPAESDGSIPDVKGEDTQVNGNISAADAARSAENIRIWRSYLPKDCVDTMIKMGWDLSV